MKRFIIPIILLLLFIAVPCWATDYHVTAAGAGAHDGSSYSGTDNSWSYNEFITACNLGTTIDDGDTAYLHGDFVLSVDPSPTAFTCHGSFESVITIDGDQNNDGLDVATFSDDGSTTFFMYFNSAEYITVTDIKFETSDYVVDNIKINVSNNLVFDDVDINANTVTGYNITGASSYITIKNSDMIQNSSNEGILGQAVLIKGGSYMYIYNNTMRAWGHDHIEILGSQSTNISFIYIHDNYFDSDPRGYGRAFGFSGSYLTSSATVTDIYFYNNYINRQRAPSGFDGTSRVNIYNNIFNETLNCCEDRCDGEAGDQAVDCSNVYNIDSGCTMNSWYCDGAASRCVGENDPWDRCTGVGTKDGGNDDPYKSGWALNITNHHADTTYGYIYNNVIANTSEAGLMVRSTTDDNDSSTNAISYMYIRNNIFYNNAAAPFGYNAGSPSNPVGSVNTWTDRTFHYSQNGGTIDNFYFENNIIYPVDNDPADDIYWNGTYYDRADDTFEFDSSPPTGVEGVSGNVTDNPDFTDVDNDQWYLQAGSPAISAGQDLDSGSTFPNYNYGWDPSTSLPPVTVDTLDQDIYTPWDIGAYVYTPPFYYVTYAGAGSHDGSSGNEWSYAEFITACNTPDTINGGDTVYLSGNFSIASAPTGLTCDGSDGSPITIDGDENNDDVDVATFSATGDYNMMYLNGADWINITDVKFESATYTSNALYVNNSDNINIYGNTFLTNSLQAIQLNNSCTYVKIYENSIKSSSTNERGAGEGILAYGGNYIYVYNNTFDNWQHNSISMLDSSSNGSISNVFVYDNYFDLSTRGYGGRIGFSGEYLGTGTCTNIYVYNNYFNKLRNQSGFTTCSNVHVYNNVWNETLNCCEDATDIDAGCTYNYYGCAGASNQCIAEDNPWDCCTAEGEGDNGQTGTSACAQGYDDRYYLRSGWLLTITSRYGDADDYYIYNNVFGPSAETAIELRTINYDIDNINIRNNIFYNNANAATLSDDPRGSSATFPDRIMYYIDSGTGSISNVSIENNLVYDLTGGSGRDDIYWDGTYYDTLEGTGPSGTGDEFASGTPTGVVSISGNISGDPLFGDVDNDQWNLQAGSPAIDTGQTLGATYDNGWTPSTSLPPATVTTDSQTTYTPWEIGAYVYILGGPAEPALPFQGAAGNFKYN